MEPQDRTKRPQEEDNGVPIDGHNGSNSEPAAKKIKLDSPSSADSRAKGVAPIKAEYLLFPPGQKAKPTQSEAEADDNDDDAAEGRTAPTPQETQQAPQKDGKRKSQRGQNKEREFGTFSDAQRLCNTIAWTPEFSPRPCKHGDRCNALHDLRKYLKEGRRPDITTFGGKCPVWEKYGKCPSGWRCLFVHSHMDEIKHEDGRSELVLVGDASKAPEGGEEAAGEIKPGVVNMVPVGIKYDLSKKRIPLEKSEQYLAWLAKDTKHLAKHYQKHKDDETNPNDYRAHEIVPPRFNPGGPIVQGYDNSKDVKFGAQIAANAPWVAVKATEALSQLLPHLRLVDLNCGCPVDAVFKSGSGSALLDSHSKLERMIRGMNAVSGEVPITAKIRMGSRDGKLTAQKLVERLALGSEDLRDMIGAPGCAAVTLHGRTRLQRYTKAADWGYIAECAALIKQFNEKSNDLADTIREADENTLPNGGKMYFLGNGDCYSHVEYFDHVDNAKVDSVMIGRGALVKPWVFEEIEKGQYLDKSSSERLTYIEKFVRYGMEAWGSDELGLNYTRRFLLEFLSFFCRYVPIGLLERLPPNLNERPPAYRGRDDLETLFASKNYKDWIKISEMFLGPAPPGFKFQPKHKSNSYEIEAEG
ncbi:hypothetical protein CHGG_01662 [Chaetomium globosum CBS 148.51]|uniref:uncharacterized protein n=1 Tax=Chaetomium globosum (strain ATCC 6205 / CBS 148.51 / DSM 1962 / NBRC 6347 / NRRL 1970) TaxID=306901 RepID=UPI00006A8CB8|nr:uncharacterized protein CHGG_01662 [Chaetomium globosum CBS 148.51]EAQ93427.1 hypothetical protein CHGG_01662 [Chaetomium globosum CBS 148.51]